MVPSATIQQNKSRNKRTKYIRSSPQQNYELKSPQIIVMISIRISDLWKYHNRRIINLFYSIYTITDDATPQNSRHRINPLHLIIQSRPRRRQRTLSQRLRPSSVFSQQSCLQRKSRQTFHRPIGTCLSILFPTNEICTWKWGEGEQA